MKNIGSYPNIRLRRNRKKEWSRRLVQESSLSPNDLIWPIFICDGKNVKERINTMPGVYRYSIDKLEKLVEGAMNKKIPMIALFPNTPDSKKNAKGSEALNKNNLVCKALRLIKKNYKDIGIMCDVALDPYTSHGHDGILKNNYVNNDETIKILVKQSLLQAEMGCDVIAPSDMMDGRIGEIRQALDKNGHKMVQILSYAVKYASNFYGPFRTAVGSKSLLKSNKKIYLSFEKFLNNLNQNYWIMHYIEWELLLIKELGFELDIFNLDSAANSNKDLIELNGKFFKIPNLLKKKNVSNINKTDVFEALKFNKSLFNENFIYPNKLTIPTSRNILEKYYN